MTGRLRYAPCRVPGCPELAESCEAHKPRPWAGRNGSTRRTALGLSESSWSKMRRAALRRDAGTCRRCGAVADEVDHLIPVAWRTPPASWSLHLSQLMCLCVTCHRMKTTREAALARAYGSPPPQHAIDSHVHLWLGEVAGGSRAAL